MELSFLNAYFSIRRAQKESTLNLIRSQHGVLLFQPSEEKRIGNGVKNMEIKNLRKRCAGNSVSGIEAN